MLTRLRSRLPRLYNPRRQALYDPTRSLLVGRGQSVIDPTVLGTYDLTTHRVVPIGAADQGVVGLGLDEMSGRARAFINKLARPVVTTDRYDQVLALLQPGSGVLLDACVSHPDPRVGRVVEQLGYEYLAVDLEGDGVQVRREDVRNLSFADATVSRIISLDTLEHVDDYRQALSEFHRVLESAGVLIVHVPCYFAERETSISIDPNDDPWGHVRYFSARELLQALTETGFVILRAGFQLDYGAALIVAGAP